MYRLLISIALISHANPAWCAESDLCRAIRAFANADATEATRSIELHTRWDGGVPSYAPACTADSTKEGALLCDYLRAHPNSEFPQDTLGQVATCLNGQPTQGPAHLLTELRHVIYSAVNAPGVRSGIYVTVELNQDVSTGAVLRITAEHSR